VINTKAYHQQLNNEFANHEGKRLDWLVGFTGLLVLTWLYALVVLGASSFVSTPLISETLLSIMVLLLIWVFCIQTLNRRPAFSHAEPEQEPETEQKPKLEPSPDSEPEESPEQKYSNSSIDDERLKRIAGKVERKVMEEKSYLNPDIDASTLASELGISVHYLSQVFTQEMQTTFYGYINDARIEAAKVALKTSEQNVLEVALSVGYNTRSSFYNAFKKRTGMTPSKYKAS
jgi:AraC-like DNA-binding protein